MMNAYWTRLHDDTYDLHRDDEELDAEIVCLRRGLFVPEYAARMEAETEIVRRYHELVANRMLEVCLFRHRHPEDPG
jgi:hypothetical protein